MTVVPYSTLDARQQLLDSISDAAGQISVAIASLSEAYELLDEQTADRVEEQLFRPVQAAYGRIKRAHSDFAGQHGLARADFAPAIAGAPSMGARGFLDAATAAIGQADQTLATLQDSMLPVEVGDPELRAGLEEVRELLGHLGARARELERTLGR